MTVNRAILLTGALAIEASLLALSHWQYNRYHQRIDEQDARNAAPKDHLTGTPLKYAYLTNQPNPNGDDSELPGRRLIAVIKNAQGEQLADLGWQPNPAVTTAAPDFSMYPTTTLDISGITLSLPIRRGWLQGPLTTTHPQLLAFLAPEALTSATVPTTYIAATSISPTLPNLTNAPPALKNPLMHASYALQWLGMALAFPILCWNLARKRKNKR